MTLNATFWANERRVLLAILLPRLTQMALAGMQAAARLVGVGFDNELYNRRAEEWARIYTDTLLADLGTTTEKIVGQALADWIARPGATVGDLNAVLTPAFGAQRANVIAVTEATRAFASGQLMTYLEAGVTHITWHTNRDELVCPMCGPLNGKVVPIGRPFGVDRKGKVITQPPYHPNCRCWVAPTLEGDRSKDTATFAMSEQQKPIRQLSQAEIEARTQADFTKFLSDFEREISAQKFETAGVFKDGKVIIIKDGTQKKVEFTHEEFQLLEGATLTHNHPQRSTFSVADIEMLADGKLKEIRATNPEYVYIMANPNNVPIDGDKIWGEYNHLFKEAKMKMYDDPSINPYDKAWEDFAIEYGLVFRKEKR